jgi:predicted acetyltransferase
MVKPADHRDDLMDVYERSPLSTPGGLLRPKALWDELRSIAASLRLIATLRTGAPM